MKEGDKNVTCMMISTACRPQMMLVVVEMCLCLFVRFLITKTTGIGLREGSTGASIEILPQPSSVFVAGVAGRRGL